MIDFKPGTVVRFMAFGTPLMTITRVTPYVITCIYFDKTGRHIEIDVPVYNMDGNGRGTDALRLAE